MALTQGAVMADRDKELFERNQTLIARMAVPPTRAQILAQIDEGLREAIQLAVRLNDRNLVRGLRMVHLDLCQIMRGALRFLGKS
jgi:hypothetical protein